MNDKLGCRIAASLYATVTDVLMILLTIKQTSLRGNKLSVAERKEPRMVLLIGIALVVLFDIAALKWGADSRDDINSPEWERRVLWGRAL